MCILYVSNPLGSRCNQRGSSSIVVCLSSTTIWRKSTLNKWKCRQPRLLTPRGWCGGGDALRTMHGVRGRRGDLRKWFINWLLNEKCNNSGSVKLGWGVPQSIKCVFSVPLRLQLLLRFSATVPKELHFTYLQFSSACPQVSTASCQKPRLKMMIGDSMLRWTWWGIFPPKLKAHFAPRVTRLNSVNKLQKEQIVQARWQKRWLRTQSRIPSRGWGRGADNYAQWNAEPVFILLIGNSGWMETRSVRFVHKCICFVIWLIACRSNHEGQIFKGSNQHQQHSYGVTLWHLRTAIIEISVVSLMYWIYFFSEFRMLTSRVRMSNKHYIVKRLTVLLYLCMVYLSKAVMSPT